MRSTRDAKESAFPWEAEHTSRLKERRAFGAALPETDNRMHGADEFAVIDELLLSAKIFAQVIADLCC